MTVPRPEDFENICRLCLKSNTLVSIIEKHSKGQKDTLSVLVRETMEMLGLSIHIDDMLPKKMCMECKNHLRSLHKFRNQCHEANDLLLESLSRFTIEKSTEWLEDEELLVNAETNPETTDDTTGTEATVSTKMKIIDIQRADRASSDEFDAEDAAKYDTDTRGHGDEEYVLYTDYEDETLEDERMVKEEVETPTVFRIHSTKSKYVCPVCKKNTTNLKVHMKSHTNERPHQCDQCEKKFRTGSKMRAHVNSVHLKLRPYVCKECGKGFLEGSNLRNHMATHDPVRKYVCLEEGCGKSFALPGTLTVHKKLHVEKNQYQCNVCMKFFRYKWALVKHLRMHTGEKPYACPMCGKKFATSTHVKTHLKMHERVNRKVYEVYAIK